MKPDDAGVLSFVKLAERGDRVVVRVIPRPDGPLNGDRQAVVVAFSPLGVSGEGMATPVNMVALDIGPEAPYASVKDLLETAKHGSGKHVYLIRFHYLPPGGWDLPRL